MLKPYLNHSQNSRYSWVWANAWLSTLQYTKKKPQSQTNPKSGWNQWNLSLTYDFTEGPPLRVREGICVNIYKAHCTVLYLMWAHLEVRRNALAEQLPSVSAPAPVPATLPAELRPRPSPRLQPGPHPCLLSFVPCLVPATQASS